jgi:membrane protein YdbS with pleckstrin-like domain
MTLAQLIKQKLYEREVFKLRRHPITFLPHILLLLVLAAIPVGLYYFFAANFPGLLTGQISYPALLILGIIYYLAIWEFFFTEFVSYYLDLWIITNDRLIGIEQEALFARTVAELDLYKIQDITSEVKGIFPTIFNFGNVFIQTAAEEGRFHLKNVPDPHNLRRKIMDLAEEDRKYHVKTGDGAI